MSKLIFLFTIAAIVLYSVAINALSPSSECYLEQRVRSALSGSTNKALNDSLLLFLQRSLNDSATGCIQQAWASNYVLQGMVNDLSASLGSGSVVISINNLFKQQSATANGYCSILQNAQSVIASSNVLTSDQRAELYTLIDYANEVARSQSCNVWGELYADPNYTQLLQNATSGLTCQQQSMLAEVTGCNANLCSSSSSH